MLRGRMQLTTGRMFTEMKQDLKKRAELKWKRVHWALAEPLAHSDLEVVYGRLLQTRPNVSPFPPPPPAPGCRVNACVLTDHVHLQWLHGQLESFSDHKVASLACPPPVEMGRGADRGVIPEPCTSHMTPLYGNLQMLKLFRSNCEL